MTHHLILLSIGPVQSFISQARKLRDLRSGSRLLSELTEAMCDAFKAAGGTVIVPGDTSAQGLPNRMLGTISGKSDEEAIAIAAEIERTVQRAWDSIAAAVLAKLPKRGGGDDWSKRFHEQTNQLLECYWAVEPYDGDNDYDRAYRTIESRLGAVKNVRVFEQIGASFGADESSRKDALTGERDALVFGYKKGAKTKEFPATTDVDLPRRLVDQGPLVGPNEGLSAVSAVKRLRQFDLGKEYFSTADVALLGLDAELKDQKDYSVSDFLTVVNPGQSGGDGQLAFAENLTDEYFEKQGLFDKGFRLDNMRAEHLKLHQAIKRHGLRQSPYYAVLSFDGDNVGQWLSGSKLDTPKGETLRDFHTFIGERLAVFAETARQIVDNEANGLTVYAGGDDYLGLLTLDAAFDVLQRLRQAFKREVSEAIQNDSRFSVTEEFTFSAGLVIAHYKRPLGDTVQLAHEAEKTAKNTVRGIDAKGAAIQRDALCIRVVKRSGEQQEVVLPWGRVEPRTDGTSGYGSLHALQNLVAGLQQYNSRTWLTESARTVSALFGKGQISHEHLEMLEAELMRLLDRSGDFGRGNSGDMGRSTKQGLRYLIEHASGKRAARNLVHALQLVDFLKRHVNDLPLITLAITDDTRLEATAA